MARKPKAAAEIIVKPEIELNMQVNTDDVVMVATATMEANLLNENKSLRDRYQALEIEVTEDKKVLEKKIDELGRTAASEQQKLLDKFNTVFNIKLNMSVSTKADEVIVALRVEHAAVSEVLRVPFSKEVKSLQQSIIDKESRIRADQDKIIENKKKIQNIPVMERQVRANVARHRLEQTTQGKELVDKMLTTMTNSAGLLGP